MPVNGAPLVLRSHFGCSGSSITTPYAVWLVSPRTQGAVRIPYESTYPFATKSRPQAVRRPPGRRRPLLG